MDVEEIEILKYPLVCYFIIREIFISGIVVFYNILIEKTILGVDDKCKIVGKKRVKIGSGFLGIDKYGYNVYFFIFEVGLSTPNPVRKTLW